MSKCQIQFQVSGSANMMERKKNEQAVSWPEKLRFPFFERRGSERVGKRQKITDPLLAGFL